MFHKVKYFILNVFVLTPTFCSRKYDIEKESMKLFGEDLKTVLQGFRRSSEYMHILEDEMANFYTHLNSMELAVLTKYAAEMTKKIEDNFKTAEEDKTAKRTYAKDSNFLHQDPPLRMLRVMDYMYTNHAIPRTVSVKESEETTTENGVMRLENRARDLIPYMAHDDLVSYRNMGYEYAGKAIHELIKAVKEGEALGGDEIRSTQQPGGGDLNPKGPETPPTTEHGEHTVEPKDQTTAAHSSTKHEGPHSVRLKKAKHH